MRRILYLATNLFDKGGIQRYCRAQVQALRSRGPLWVMSLRGGGNNAFESTFPVDYVGGGGWFGRITYAARASFVAWRQRPEVIWVNHVKLSPVAHQLSRALEARFVLNVYGLEVWSGLTARQRKALHAADRIVSDSHATAEYLIQHLGIRSQAVSVVWDPVDVGRFAPMRSRSSVLKRYGIPERLDACYLMSAGRLAKGSRHKGYDRVLDFMAGSIPDGIYYLIVGDGDDRQRLQDKVAAAGLEQKVFFLGSVPESQLAEVYSACDVFVLVSDRGPGRGEGVPLTPLEAAACGKPVIVGNEDGSVEAAEHDVTGLVISPRRPQDLREAILSLARDPERRARLGNAGRERIIREFALPRFEDQTMAVLESVTGKPSERATEFAPTAAGGK